MDKEKDIKHNYGSPRWTNEIADCSMPMTFDTYSNCSFGCLYCFSQFQRGLGGAKDKYFRKLGSDMGDGVTGGGLHGKDLSKADVSVNIYAHLEAQRTGKPQAFSCAIGDTEVNGVPFASIVETARQYIKSCGGFEKFAEWGLI